MAKIKIKKGDQVLVISGKDKGKKGEVLRVNKSANTLVVEGINISKKHIKNSPNVTQAGIVDTESPINISNVMFIDLKIQILVESHMKNLIQVNITEL